MESLRFLLQMIHNREMALPDFQRDFVWDPAMTDELIESIILNYPAGTLLRVKNGQELLFQPRAFEGAPTLGQTTPAYLTLDGQQRLTCLYQAFYGVGTHRFLLDLAGLEGGMDLEDCAIFDRADRVQRSFGSVERQAELLMFPMGRLFGNGGFDKWTSDVLRVHSSNGASATDVLALGDRLAQLRAQWIRPIEEYDFPMVTVSEQTSAAAICMIFETLNRTGVKLSVFELLTARFWPKDVKLRAMWEEALDRHSILEEFGIDPYYVLQIIGLIEPGTDQDGGPRAPSVKRGQVLAQTADQARRGWQAAVDGLAEVLQILREDCGVAGPRWLPYGTMLIPAAGAWAKQRAVAHAAYVGANRTKLARWYWCASLGQRYENAPNAQAARDYVQLIRWMTEPDAPTPESVSDFQFHSGTLRTTTPRQRAVYRASMALILRHGARDFHKRGSIGYSLLVDPKNPVDDHHVFPVGFLDPLGVPNAIRDSILNRTLIDRATNIRIGKRAPSDYLSEIRIQWPSESEFQDLLDSHLLPSGEDSPLMSDALDSFLQWRESRIAEEIDKVTGSRVIRGEDLEEVHVPRVELGGPEPVPGEAGAVDHPSWLIELADRLCSPWTRPLLLQFVESVLRTTDVELRRPTSETPYYFQMRSPRFKQVLAYVAPTQAHLRIEFRLPADHDTYGRAQPLHGAYGIRLLVAQRPDVAVAVRLMRDALGQPV